MRFKPRLELNPIIVKEIRSRMRGARAFVILTGVLLLLGAVSYALYRIVLITSSYTRSPLSPQIGQTLFGGLAFLELMMVCFITPAITAGAISDEQEKLTYERLLATPMRPASILRGKLVSALSYVFLLISAAVPLASLVFIFGGVAPRDMLKSLVILVAAAVTLGMVGVFMSAWLKRTARATVLSYLVVLALLIGPVFVYILTGVLWQAEPPRWLLVPNPLSALFSALSPSMPGDGPASIFLNLGMALGGNLGVLTGSGNTAGVPRPLYHYALPLYGALTLVLYLLSIRLVQPVRRWRPGWKEALGALALLLIFGGVVVLAFASTADRYERASLWPTPPPRGVQEAVIEREIVVPVPRVEPTEASVAISLTPTPTPLPASIPPLPGDEQAAIYAVVVRQLLATSYSLGELPEPLVVYLLPTTRDGLVNPKAPYAEPRPLPEAVQGALVAALTDLPAEFLWVVPLEGDADATLTLGNVHLQKDGTAVVSVSLYLGELGSIGQTYVLEQVEDLWQVAESARNNE